MSSILISEHSKSICELEVHVEMNKYNTTKTKQMDGVEYCSCRRKSGVESGAR